MRAVPSRCDRVVRGAIGLVGAMALGGAVSMSGCTDLEATSTPCTVTGNTVKGISWQQDGMATVDGYRVWASLVGDPDAVWFQIAELPVQDHDRLDGVITRYHPGVHQAVPYLRATQYEGERLYQFRVTSWNAAGESDPSNTITECVPRVWLVGVEPYPGVQPGAAAAAAPSGAAAVAAPTTTLDAPVAPPKRRPFWRLRRDRPRPKGQL